MSCNAIERVRAREIYRDRQSDREGWEVVELRADGGG